jgi:type IV pilus assembly protein PilO
MRRDFTFGRRTILGGLILLLLADVALAVYSWNLASTPRASQRQFDQETKQLELFRADIKRAQEIKNDVPKIGTAWDSFELKFPPASSGYSTVTSDLGAIAKSAGVQVESVGFKQKEISGRGLTEVSIEAAVSGDYSNVVRFVNGIQRSPRVYALDTLALANQAQGQGPSNVIKVAMHLKTYFRTAA